MTAATLDAPATNGTATGGTTTTTTPKAKRPRKPTAGGGSPAGGSPAKASGSALKRTRSLADLTEQLATLKLQQLREAHAAALSHLEALHDTLAQMVGEPGCPLPRESVTAVMYVLEKAEADWRRATWAPPANAGKERGDKGE